MKEQSNIQQYLDEINTVINKMPPDFQQKVRIAESTFAKALAIDPISMTLGMFLASSKGMAELHNILSTRQ